MPAWLAVTVPAIPLLMIVAGREERPERALLAGV
jgi:hypothetical protein